MKAVLRRQLPWFVLLVFLASPAAAQEDDPLFGEDPLTAKSKTKKGDSKAKEDGNKKIKLAGIVIKGELSEAPSQAGLFGELQQNLRDTIARLDKAAKDDDIKAVVLRLRNPSLGRARINELRAAVQRTRKAGKKVYAQLEMGMTADYLIACACDEIVMPPSGMLLVPGVRVEVMYFKGLLDKLGIEGDFLHMGEAKGAAEPFTRKSMSAGVRKNLAALVDDYYEQLVETISEDRGIDPEVVRLLVDQALFTAGRAQKLGLVDRVAYEDSFRESARKQLKAGSLSVVKNYGKKKLDTDFSGPMGFFKLMQLMMGIEPDSVSDGKKKIALVYATGPIMTGKSETDVFGAQTMGSDTIVAALRKAEENDDVAAIVMRVDSPGGSALASDLIWREVVRIKKPIVVSMGDIAASGGYYISMGANKIFAEPGTLTGSIGVVGGKLATEGMYDKLGLNTSVIARGLNNGIFASADKFTESERQAMLTLMRDTYEQFTRKAAEGRKMQVDELKKLAGGRVWTGRMAKENGLVDELGTLEDAMRAAKKLAGLKPDAKTGTLILPEPKSFFDELFGVADDEVSRRLGKEILREAGELAEPWREVLLLRRAFEQPVAVMLPFRLKIE